MPRSYRDKLADQLSQKQIEAAYALLENELKKREDQMTQDELSEYLNISRGQLYIWRHRNEVFIEFKKELARNSIDDMVGLFARKLRESMEGTNGAPSQKALDLFAKIAGFQKNEHDVNIHQMNDERTIKNVEDQIEKLEAMKLEKEEENKEEE